MLLAVVLHVDRMHLNGSAAWPPHHQIREAEVTHILEDGPPARDEMGPASGL